MKINIFGFFIGAFIGFLLIYVTTPKPKIIFKVPNEKDIFVNENNYCIRYKAKQIKCI